MPATKRARRLARVASCSGEVQEVQQRAVREIIDLQEKLLADEQLEGVATPQPLSMSRCCRQLRIEKLKSPVGGPWRLPELDERIRHVHSQTSTTPFDLYRYFTLGRQGS